MEVSVKTSIILQQNETRTSRVKHSIMIHKCKSHRNHIHQNIPYNVSPLQHALRAPNTRSQHAITSRRQSTEDTGSLLCSVTRRNPLLPLSSLPFPKYNDNAYHYDYKNGSDDDDCNTHVSRLEMVSMDLYQDIVVKVREGPDGVEVEKWEVLRLWECEVAVVRYLEKSCLGSSGAD